MKFLDRLIVGLHRECSSETIRRPAGEGLAADRELGPGDGLDRPAGQGLEESPDRLDVQVDPGGLVVHRHDDPGADRLEQAGRSRGSRSSAARRPGRARPPPLGSAPARPRRAGGRGRRGRRRATPSARKWTIATSSSGRFSGDSKNADRLEPEAAHLAPAGGKLQRPDDLERRDDLAEVAVVAVVLVADDHQVGRLVDRPVAPRIGRAVGVQDDPPPIRLDPERRMPVPVDDHGDLCEGGRWPSGHRRSGESHAQGRRHPTSYPTVDAIAGHDDDRDSWRPLALAKDQGGSVGPGGMAHGSGSERGRGALPGLDGTSSGSACRSWPWDWSGSGGVVGRERGGRIP